MSNLKQVNLQGYNLDLIQSNIKGEVQLNYY